MILRKHVSSKFNVAVLLLLVLGRSLSNSPTPCIRIN